MTIGKNIKKLRTARGLTQDQLAEQLYVTRQTISNWERGTSRPDLDQLEAIAGALGTDVTTLLYGTRPAQSPPTSRRIGAAVLLLGLAVILWFVGARLLWPCVRLYTNRTYDYSFTILFRGGYQAVTAMLLGAGLLALMALRWDLSLGRRGRRIAGIAGGLLLAETAFVCATAPFIQRMADGGALQPVANLTVWISLKEVSVPLGLLCGGALFLALNPARKTQ